jgi:succinate dehydrogenase / fumarate reductase membrane anchor subunit
MNIKLIKEPFGGMTQWVYQRFTALFMFIYLLIMMVLVSIHDVLDYFSWVSIFDSWWVRFGTLIFFYLMFFHSWIGMLHVTEDYIKWNIGRRIVNFCFLIMIILQLLILSIFLIKGG